MADLAIQTALNVAGVQDGYDTGQTAQAGKEGLQLNSAGGSAPGPGNGVEIDPGTTCLDPLALGDGTWLTIHDQSVRRWRTL
ncbi:hypothetical protein ACFYSH_13260 [Streptomyces sp. NPDC005791]|uniref:hypothetical protein n=1 Tax=Streptomyces sp. NPDC005791 TaxID=3364732 RepID=UPI003689A451